MNRILISSSLILLPVLLILFLIGYNLIFTSQSPEEAVHIEVKPGSSLTKVATQLQTSGVIRSALALKIIARWNKSGHQIQTGKYLFDESATPSEVLDRLIRGDVEKVSLTIPEGFALQQIIARLADAGFARRENLEALVYNRKFINSLGIAAESLEGYLFPETYLFAPGIDERTLLRMMVNQFSSHISPELLLTAKKLGLNQHQLVTLASIIEKETGVVEEMPLISSVFHNRLKRNIPLQTDPTVIYGIKNFDGNITRKHLETPTPYNTYLTRGLPPGPIASPGLAALNAAAHPAATKYLYFVARGDGTHQFSKTLKEHNSAVRQYQLRRRK
jgi:UPF0755 protein